MATTERIIPATIAEDGSIHYTSVTSPPDDSTAVCYMVPNRVIPVIFVPGVMGSNLYNPTTKNPVWLVNSRLGVAISWLWRGAKTRKKKLDPSTTDVYDGGDIPPGTAQSETELRRRGWGTVGKMSYGTFLTFLEGALNDAHKCETGYRAQLMKQLVAHAPGVSVLSHTEVALSYKYQLPVHAVGYNWLQSNADSAQHLADKVKEFTEYYKGKGKICEKVIIVTHSMGGLVARYYSEVDGYRDDILGIVHGVMPATGSATAYKRVTSGSEGVAGLVIGPDSSTMTPVFAQSPGPLQLLPSVEYGMDWLKIDDGKEQHSLPLTDPYEEIYLKRGKWWGLVNERLLSPLDKNNNYIDNDWDAYALLINKKVRKFHEDIGSRFHDATYAFYGDDEKHQTWGDITWKRKTASFGTSGMEDCRISDVLDAKSIKNDGEGSQYLENVAGECHLREKFVLQDAIENGDGTVPIRSGCFPAGKDGVLACVAYQDVDHEGAFNKDPQQLFALWAVTRIVGNVNGTALEYRS